MILDCIDYSLARLVRENRPRFLFRIKQYIGWNDRLHRWRRCKTKSFEMATFSEVGSPRIFSSWVVHHMNIEKMKEEDIKGIIAQSIALGMALQFKVHCPEQNKISKRNAALYLRSLGFRHPNTVLSIWIKEGKLNPYRNSSAKNSTIKIYIDELQSVILDVMLQTKNQEYYERVN